MGPNAIISILKNLKPGCRVGVTSGCFDLLHYYHVRFLERCRERCDLLAVGVDSDMLVCAHKRPPVIPEHHRVAMVAALRCVDIAFLMPSTELLDQATEYCNVLFRNSEIVYGHQITARCEIQIIPDIQELYSTGQIREVIAAESPKPSAGGAPYDGS